VTGQVISGALGGAGMRVAVAASRWNEFIVERLVAGALDGLARHGVADDDVDLVWVPGAFELPLYDAVITLGAVIRGATSHYELVSGQAAAGVARASLDTGVPVVFGVLTTENIEQAIERAGSKAGNKGFESATVAIEMVDLLRRLPAGGAHDPGGAASTTR
jgi:6,7-dimethyl-8-ribityllumazine synthase